MWDRAEKAAESIRQGLREWGPLSAFDVAHDLGFVVHMGSNIEPRGFTNPKARCPHPKLFVRRDRGVREEHACAHEVGHHHIWDQNADPVTVERACDRFAAALLMPRGPFAATARELSYAPREIQRVWRFSSLEAITRRVGEVCSEVVTAAWDDLAPRWHSPCAPGASLALLELGALGAAYAKGRGSGMMQSDHGTAWAWRTNPRSRYGVSVCKAA